MNFHVATYRCHATLLPECQGHPATTRRSWRCERLDHGPRGGRTAPTARGLHPGGLTPCHRDPPPPRCRLPLTVSSRERPVSEETSQECLQIGVKNK